jgi:hypothetical protein
MSTFLSDYLTKFWLLSLQQIKNDSEVSYRGFAVTGLDNGKSIKIKKIQQVIKYFI